MLNMLLSGFLIKKQVVMFFVFGAVKRLKHNVSFFYINAINHENVRSHVE